MKKISRRSFLKATGIATLTAALAGCGNSASAATPTVTGTVNGEAVDFDSLPDNMDLTDAAAEEITLPISDVSLSFFAMPESIITSKMTGYDDMTVHQEAETMTGISINWREESYSDPSQKMNLMFSTGETEDIVWDAHVYGTGGAKKLLDQELILPLNKYIEYYAPNLKKLLLETEGLLEEISVDDGRIYCFPEIRLDPATRANSGLAIRKDWLDIAGLESPETIDDWYNAMKTFQDMDLGGNGTKDEYFVSLGRSKVTQTFATLAVAYGIRDDFYLDNGVVKYGPYEDAYKDFLTEMAKWYSEKLLDPEFSTQDSTQFSTKMTNNTGCGFYGNLGGNLGTFINARQDDGTGYDLVGVAMPKAPDGKVYAAAAPYAQMVPHGAAISTTNTHIAETVKWLDWHYSEVGHMLYNWGVEGQSYEMVDGVPQFTDLILNNPDGLSVEEASARYAGGVITQMPIINDTDVYLALKGLDQQKEANAIWCQADQSLILPTLFFSDEQTTINANVVSEVETYVGEMMNKYVMGVSDLSSFADYQAQLEALGIEEVLASYQEAYDSQYA